MTISSQMGCGRFLPNVMCRFPPEWHVTISSQMWCGRFVPMSSGLWGSSGRSLRGLWGGLWGFRGFRGSGRIYLHKMPHSAAVCKTAFGDILRCNLGGTTHQACSRATFARCWLHHRSGTETKWPLTNTGKTLPAQHCLENKQRTSTYLNKRRTNL